MRTRCFSLGVLVLLVLGVAACRPPSPGGATTLSTPVVILTPVRTGPALPFRAVSAGNLHTCALDNNDAAWCWGSGNDVLGNSTVQISAVPVPVQGGNFFSAISAGSEHTCGITLFYGKVLCWGDNVFGEVGNGSTTGAPVSQPTPIAGNFSGVTFASISAGGESTCAVTSQNVGYCWGRNDDGQLGTGSAGAPAYSPVLVTGQHSWSSIVVSQISTSQEATHTCGVTTDHALFCWGTNANGELGTSAVGGSATPVAFAASSLPGNPPVSALFAEVGVGSGYTCGIPVGELTSVFCWGDNSHDQLGNSSRGGPAPTLVQGSAGFQYVAVGYDAACAENAASTANTQCWGDDFFGQLGDGLSGSINNSALPMAVSGSHHFSQLSVGVAHACGIDDTGLFCWGYGQFGQLGDGMMNDSAVPVQVV